MTAETTLLLLAVVGAIGAGVGATRLGGRAAGGWAALLVIGQAAGLRFIEAGPVVAYQHYRSPGTFTEDPIALGIVLLQVIGVAVGVISQRSAIRGAIRSVPTWLLALVGLAILGTAVAPSADPGQYAREIMFGASLQLVAIGNMLLVAVSLPERALERLSSGWERMATHVGTPRADRVGLSLAAAVTVVCAVLAIFVYERHPHVPDEVAYLYHARYLAAGDLEMPAPPVPGAFELDLMSYEADRWYSPVPPGWPAVLAVGAKVGVPWLVNPLLAGLGVLLTYLLGWRLYDRRTGFVAATLLAVSPWYLFLGMSFMTHMASFVFAVGAADAVCRWRDSGRLGWLFLAGGLAGCVGLVRPLEAVAVGGVLGAAVLWTSRGRRLVPSCLAFGLGAIAVSSLVVPYNVHFTGSPTGFPIMAYTEALYGPGANSLGFGPDRGLGWTGLDPFPGHGARDVAVNTVLNSHAINAELFGWAAGAWFLILLAVALRRRSSVDGWVIAALIVPAGLHAFYWFAGGPDFGARYWFLVILPLVLLAARGFCAVGTSRTQVAGLTAAGVAVIAALTVFVPWRAADKYDGYRGMRSWARAISADPALDDALILVQGKRHPDFASAAAYNPLDLGDDGPVFAWDRDAARRDSLLAAFPNRIPYVLEGPTLTGGAPRLQPLPDAR